MTKRKTGLGGFLRSKRIVMRDKNSKEIPTKIGGQAASALQFDRHRRPNALQLAGLHGLGAHERGPGLSWR